MESIGIKEIKDCCFVLGIIYIYYNSVAGGLGERLGYNGIKISIPMELVTQTTFL